MAGRYIKPGRTTSGNVPRITSRPYATGQTFKIGAILIFDGSKNVIEASATPTTAVGIAAEPAGSRPGFNAANSPLVVTGANQEVGVYDANDDTVFSMRGVNGGTDPVVPVQATHVGTKYGAIKDANGIWALNIADTTNLMFEVFDIDIPNNIFFCKFLTSAMVEP